MFDVIVRIYSAWQLLYLSGAASVSSMGSVRVVSGWGNLSGIGSSESVGEVPTPYSIVRSAASSVGSSEEIGAVQPSSPYSVQDIASIASSEDIGSPYQSSSVSIGAQSIVSGESLGAVYERASIVIVIGGIQSSESVSSPVIDVERVISGISSGEEFGSITLSGQTWVSNAGGISSTTSIGDVSRFIGELYRIVSGINGEESFGGVTLSLMTVCISIDGIGSDEYVGSVNALSIYSVSVDGIPSEEGNGAVVVVSAVAPHGIASGESVGTPHVAVMTYSVVVSGIVTSEDVSDLVSRRRARRRHRHIRIKKVPRLVV
jgi:hypothetical protein